MKRITSFLLLCGFIFSANAQWTPTKAKRTNQNEISVTGDAYSLDIPLLKNQLKNAQEMGSNAQAVEISIPTKGGKIEKFAVYSFPVMVKELADQYQLGSYVGTSVSDPGKYLRFSLSPTNFQSMIIDNGNYEFIDVLQNNKTVYLVHSKTAPAGGKSFNCSTAEDPAAVAQISEMLKKGNHFSNQPSDFSKNSDRKYRTMRLALAVTGEYTTFHGGTVAGALSAMNATMTRVNGVFEKDFALHLNIQNYPSIIYTNAATDPYSAAAAGSAGAWNLEVQQDLTAKVGDANYDIGHLFGASGGGGNAGCIGCVCVAPTTAVPKGKGSGYTSPGDAIPQGDNFDIDYVAHEMGHQLGGNHTFSHGLETAGTNMEPGSGSTIMGYAGITGTNTDVQAHSDPYFHAISIVQIQTNLTSKTCDVETAVANNIPVISALPTYNIPKGTAFVLSATVTDPENDPMTFTWEQVDNASTTINKTNLGTTTSGAAFRSVLPSTGGATRYFPRLSSVLAGTLDNSNNLWEAVPTVARSMQFAITVRDNNPAFNQQQTTNGVQNIVVGNDGPFTVTTTSGGNNSPTPVTWTVANTTASPYNVANVKIDYTTDNGATWVTLIASTPNDGSENVTFTGVPSGTSVKLRVSAVGNVFYAVSTVTVTSVAACSGAAPTGLTASAITGTSANLSWGTISGATYTVRYRIVGSATWTTVNTSTASLALTGLTPATSYEYQVLAICATTSPYSGSFNFSTSAVVYCTASSTNTTYEFIANVSLANVNNTSGPSMYTDYSTNAALQINVTAGMQYTLTVTKDWSAGGADYDAVSVWIDYNNDGTFDTSVRVMASPVTNTATPVSTQFTIPTTAVTSVPLRMRVIDIYAGSANAGATYNSPCGTFTYGEVEDYNVFITPQLSTSDIDPKNGIEIYPNPVSDVLNISKVSDKASFEIYSVTGQILNKGIVRDGKIVVSELIKGNYILKITDKEVSSNFKFIKK